MTDVEQTDEPELALEPLDGIPAWCNDFLRELANPEHMGVIKYAARAVERSWQAVDYWRRANKPFALRLAQIYEAVNQDVDDQIEHRLLKVAIDGHVETTTETDEDGDVISIKEKQIYDPKVAQWLLAQRRRQRYGPEQGLDGNLGPITFVFKLGDDKEEIEGEATEDGELEPEGQAPLTELPEKTGLN